jgi:hypothetical protein
MERRSTAVSLGLIRRIMVAVPMFLMNIQNHLEP